MSNSKLPSFLKIILFTALSFELQNFFFIFWIWALIRCMICKYFLPFYRLSSLFYRPLLNKVLNFDKSIHFCSCIAIAFSVLFKHYQIQGKEDLYLLLKILCLVLVIRSLIDFEFNFLYSSVHGYSVFPTSFAQQTVLIPLSGLGTLVEVWFNLHIGLLLDSLVYTTSLLVFIFMPVLHCLDYYSFKIKKCESYNFVVFQNYSSCLGFLYVQLNFRMHFSISAKKKKKCHSNLDRDWIESVYHFQ